MIGGLRALILLICLGADGGAAPHQHAWRCPAFPPPGCNVLRACTCACGARQTQRSEDCT